MDDKQTNEPKELSLDHVFVIDNNLMPLVFMLIDEVKDLKARTDFIDKKLVMDQYGDLIPESGKDIDVPNKEAISVGKCEKTLSGRHIWNKNNNISSTENMQVYSSKRHGTVYLIVCRACGVVDDRYY